MTTLQTSPSAALGPRLALFTVEQYHRMLETGILAEGARIELLDGLLVHKDRSAHGEDAMTIGKRHEAAVSNLLLLSTLLAARGFYLKCQGPITLPPKSEPEPDATIVRGKPGDYLERHPGPGDLTCVIEVADSSLEYDRTVKLGVYARAGVSHYVLVNLPEQCIECFARPLPAQSRYAEHQVVNGAAEVRFPLDGADVLAVRADRILP